MRNNDIYICPSISGYQFSPSSPKIDARLLALLRPSPDEIQDVEPFVPIFRADWLQEFPSLPWPKQRVVYLAGLRATRFRSDVHRGGGSVWAVARVVKVLTTPSQDSIAGELESLVEKFINTISGAGEEFSFANNSHLELRSETLSNELDSAYLRLRSIRENGLNIGPFRRRNSRSMFSR